MEFNSGVDNRFHDTYCFFYGIFILLEIGYKQEILLDFCFYNYRDLKREKAEND